MPDLRHLAQHDAIVATPWTLPTTIEEFGPAGRMVGLSSSLVTASKTPGSIVAAQRQDNQIAKSGEHMVLAEGWLRMLKSEVHRMVVKRL